MKDQHCKAPPGSMQESKQLSAAHHEKLSMSSTHSAFKPSDASTLTLRRLLATSYKREQQAERLSRSPVRPKSHSANVPLALHLDGTPATSLQSRCRVLHAQLEEVQTRQQIGGSRLELDPRNPGQAKEPAPGPSIACARGTGFATGVVLDNSEFYVACKIPIGCLMALSSGSEGTSTGWHCSEK